MLWYKAWLETRSRFLVGLVLLIVVACGTVFDYLAVETLMPLASTIDTRGEIGRLLKETADLSREFRGHIWVQWFRQNLTQIGTLFAVLLGSGSLLSHTSGGALFTLSMPASRSRVLGVRAATGLMEFFVLALVPSIMIPLLAPAVGESYSVLDALVHGVCLFIAGATFFSLAVLLSTVFNDLWRPLLIACAVAVTLATGEYVLGRLTVSGVMPLSFQPFGIFRVMSGEAYFRSGGLPWLGLLAATAISATMLYAAARNMERRDF